MKGKKWTRNLINQGAAKVFMFLLELEVNFFQ
jgi:hypothetical protein